MQQLQSNGTYNELWPKTDCYTKEETNTLIQNQTSSVDWQIGDIRGTVKNDLSNNWLLCDNNVIDGEKYPVLQEYLGGNLGVNLIVQSSNNSFVLPNGFATNAGQIVIVNNQYLWGGYYQEGSQYYPAIAYSSDLNTWNVAKLTASGYYTSDSVIYKIKYLNNIYVAIDTNYRMYFSNTLSTRWVQSTLQYCQDIDYYNGIWALLITNSSSASSIYTSTNPLNGFTFLLDLKDNSNGKCYMSNIKHQGSQWVIAGCIQYTRAADGTSGSCLLTTSTLTNSFSNYNVIKYSLPQFYTSSAKYSCLIRTSNCWYWFYGKGSNYPTFSIAKSKNSTISSRMSWTIVDFEDEVLSNLLRYIYDFEKDDIVAYWDYNGNLHLMDYTANNFTRITGRLNNTIVKTGNEVRIYQSKNKKFSTYNLVTSSNTLPQVDSIGKVKYYIKAK